MFEQAVLWLSYLNPYAPPQTEDKIDYISKQPQDICINILSRLSARDLNHLCLTCRSLYAYLTCESLIDVACARNFFKTMRALPTTCYIERKDIDLYADYAGWVTPLSQILLRKSENEEIDFTVHRKLRDTTKEKSFFQKGISRHFEAESVSVSTRDGLPKRTELSLRAGLDELNAFYRNIKLRAETVNTKGKFKKFK